MVQYSQTKLDAGFHVDVTVTLPDGSKYHAWRAISHDAMQSIRQGAPESGASMMLEMMGQQAIEELREQLAPGIPPSESL